MLALLALLAAAPGFAPPPDVPLIVRSEEVRDDGRTTRRFVARRRIVFARDAGGRLATVTAIDAEAEAPPAERARYRATYAALIGQPVRVRLNDRGEAVAVEELDRHWARYVAALPRPTGAAGGQVTAAIAALPRERRMAVLASPALGVIAAPGELHAVAARPVELAGPAPYAAARLTGSETVVGDGARRLATLTARGTTAGGLAVTLDQRREIDAATGLVRASERRTAVTGPAVRLRIVTSTTIER